jgi:2-dehydropantoate 2-reductase
MRVAVLGAGSVGMMVGALLTKGGVSAQLVDSYPANVAALNQNGARITGYLDELVPVKATTYDSIEGVFDLVLLLTKHTGMKAAIDAIRGHLTSDFAVVAMSNGIPEDAVAEMVGAEHVLSAAINFAATMKGPGVTEATSNFRALPAVFNLGEYSGKATGRTQQVQRILSCVGPTKISDNMRGMKWTKLMGNATFSGLSVVLGCTFGEASADDCSYTCARYISLEVARVMEAQGLTPVEWWGGIIPTVKNLAFSNKRELFGNIPELRENRKGNHGVASMLQDIRNGRLPTEIDEINGKVVSTATKCGIPAPFNTTIVDIVHKIERGELQPSWDNLKLFQFPPLPD